MLNSIFNSIFNSMFNSGKQASGFYRQHQQKNQMACQQLPARIYLPSKGLCYTENHTPGQCAPETTQATDDDRFKPAREARKRRATLADAKGSNP